jgi:EmrB/QacA subfamily drug resistance transporter
LSGHLHRSVKKPEDFRITAVVVASALFMQNIDGTIVATALPSMARDLGVNPVHMSAAITSYLVALTVFIPASGWVADRWGAKRVFMAAIAIFTAASVLCALSQSLAELVAARILQGMGGAMMVPVGRLLLLRRVQRDQLLSATTWLTAPALIGPVLGPPLGGFMTDTLSWKSVFWINLPVGILGLVLSAWLIPRSEASRPPPPDLRGMLLFGLALTGVMVGAETVARGLIPRGWPEGIAALGLVFFWLGVRHCRRVPHPAIDFSLLKIPTFNASTVAGCLFRIGAGALPFLIPLTLQTSLGLSATHSGLFSLASATGAFSMRPMARRAMQWLSVRAILVRGSLVFAAIVWACAAAAWWWPAGAVFLIAALLASGLARSLIFAMLGALAFVDVPPKQLAAATSLQGTAQQLPKAVGVALAAVTLQASMALGDRVHAERLDFIIAFVVVGIAVGLAAPLFAALPHGAGEGMASRAAPRRGGPVSGVPETKPAAGGEARPPVPPARND